MRHVSVQHNVEYVWLQSSLFVRNKPGNSYFIKYSTNNVKYIHEWQAHDQVTWRHATLEGVSHKYNCLLIPKAQHFSTFEFKARERRYKNSIIFAGIFFLFFFFSWERPKNHQCCNHYIDLMQLLKSKYKQVNNLVKINFNVTTGEIELCKSLLQTSTKKFGHIKSVVHLEFQGWQKSNYSSQFPYLNKRKRYTND